MKTKITLGLLSLFSFTFSFAQPSDSQIKSKALSDGAKSVEFYGTGRVHNTLTETYYIRSLEATFDTQYPGVTQRVSKEYKYNKSGGSWSFTRTFTVQSLFDGIPNPTENELMAMINTDMRKFLGGSYSDIVGDVEYIKIAPDPKWMWEDVKSCQVNMEAVYSKKMSSTEVSRVKQLHTIKLYADEFKGPWKKFIASKDGYPEILSTKTYTAEEIRNMKTLYDIQLDKEAEALMGSLPTVNIPQFNNTKEAIVYTYKMLRESTYDEFKAYCYQIMGPQYYLSANTKALSPTGERLFEELEDAFAARSAFKDQYCEHPAVKANGETSMSLYNRDKSRYTRIVVKENGGKYEMTTLDFYVFVKDDLIAACKSAPAQCGEPINTEVKKKPTYSVGEECLVYVRGYNWIDGVVKEKDQSFPDRYLVSVERTGKTAWYNADEMDKKKQTSRPATTTSTTQTATTSTSSTSTSTSSSTSVATSQYKIGDAVEVTYKGKKHQGKIEKIDSHNPNRYFVRTSTMSSLWHNSDVLAPASEEASAEDEKKEEKKKVNGSKVKSGLGGLKGKIKN